MLTIKVQAVEVFDENTNEFVQLEETILQLEHSLVALSKWESIWEKPFLTMDERTNEEIYSYIECMNVGPEFSRDVLLRLSKEDFEQIHEYLQKKMTATWFNEHAKHAKSSETLTNELIYHWMNEANIPWEAQSWHLARLFTLIRVTGLKRTKPKPMGKAEAMRRQRELNEQRRAQFGSKG